MQKVAIILFFLLIQMATGFAQPGQRIEHSLNSGWVTIANDTNIHAYDGFEVPSFNDKNWKSVNVPHNWDDYGGYRRMRHGNRHGYAWYRKNFKVKAINKSDRYFLFFEGVGSYATVFLNGKKIGYHAGGRTTFTIDATNEIYKDNRSNVLAVRADHPANIQDLPFVCGGCSDERGFSEGSQPMGIFRPVHLVITNPVRIEPFGVHVWSDANASDRSAKLQVATELKNYGNTARTITVVNRVQDKQGKTVSKVSSNVLLKAGAIIEHKQVFPVINQPRLWDTEDPYLYTVITELVEKDKVTDRLNTDYGIRTISWPLTRPGSNNQFLVNGKPVFLNGVAEYEHLFGQSHSFTPEQIKSRVMQMKTAGFNSFRDGHQPHNLLYQKYWDELGILWWTQLSAHVWYDTKEFKENFKTILKEWVKERRNSPSIMLWGLQNESKLSKEFAQECTQIIRDMDPTASSQRLVTTCNGGEGTDWDVPQNWTGTYGGNPAKYGEDVQRQVLIGEYGAWRTIDLHTEGGFVQDGAYSEDRMTQLMEMKVKLAEEARHNTTGHFYWIFTSHDNPGRVQGGEGLRELDRIGPVNYKGLLTPWEEPLDVYYMYRSNYAPAATEPMVYIVSHTWPDRWTKPGKKDGITVYSNCDEVELFNDVNAASLGKRTKQGKGTHFSWDGVDINYNVLYAVGYVRGKPVARDYIVLNHLPKAPGFNAFLKDAKPLTAAAPGYNYLYRINCGGPDYKDVNGNTWLADRKKTSDKVWGSASWTDDYPGLSAFFGSQRRTFDPIKGTADWPLFQNFRYGREKLSYEFPVPDGEYLVELYFTEPWLGTGGGMDCTGWRLFDVAINNKTVIKDLDIWKETGHDAALKKTVKASVKGGKLVISFPRIASAQALISGIAIATTNKNANPAPSPEGLIKNLQTNNQTLVKEWSLETWMDTGDKQYKDQNISFSALSSDLFGAEWIKTPKFEGNSKQGKIASFTVNNNVYVYIGVDTVVTNAPKWLTDYEDTRTFIKNSNDNKFLIYRKQYKAGQIIELFDNEPGASMYTVAVGAVSSIEPAYDLKKNTSYRPSAAKIYGTGILKDTVLTRETLRFTKAKGDTIEWEIATGVADIYSLTLRYSNYLDRNLSGKLEFLSIDGTLLKSEALDFSPSIKGKWSYLTTSTGSMVNAGYYKLRIISEDAETLTISALDVQ